MIVRIAAIEEIEDWWDEKINKNPTNLAYKEWKDTFVNGNKIGERKTFFVFEDGKYVGQGTLLLKSQDEVMTGPQKAEIIKLEINREYKINFH